MSTNLGTSPSIRTQAPSSSRTSPRWLFTMSFTSLILLPIADWQRGGTSLHNIACVELKASCLVSNFWQLLALEVPFVGNLDGLH